MIDKPKLAQRRMIRFRFFLSAARDNQTRHFMILLAGQGRRSAIVCLPS
jgi:hypothetical protein